MRLVETEGLGATRDAGSSEWAKLWSADPYQHPWYLPGELHVASSHLMEHYYLPPHLRPAAPVKEVRQIHARRLVAVNDTGPVMGLDLSVETYSGSVHLSAFGRPLYVLQDPTVPERVRRTAAKLIHRRLTELSEEFGTGRYHLRDFLIQGRLSYLSELILREGGISRPYLTQLVDLARPVAEVRAELRPSLRNLLGRERPGSVVALVTSQDVTEGHRDALHALHVKMHGRERRTANNWNALLESVRSGDAFFGFMLRGGEYVAAAYFPFSDRYCHYSIAANDPQRYGNGLSHLLLWRAIEHAQRLGCQYFEVGDRIYPEQHSYVDPKFHAISHFKAAYAVNPTVRLDILSAG